MHYIGSNYVKDVNMLVWIPSGGAQDQGPTSEWTGMHVWCKIHLYGLCVRIDMGLESFANIYAWI